MRRHKAAMHGIDVVWYKCDIPLCEYQAKEQAAVKRHKAAKHGINVVWFNCDVEGCRYQSKEVRKCDMYGVAGCDARAKQVPVLLYSARSEATN